MLKSRFSLFTDAATSPQKNIAVGAFICFKTCTIEQLQNLNSIELSNKIAFEAIYQIYESKKSTLSEMQTVIDGLCYIQSLKQNISHVCIFTDCQSLYDLFYKRREKLEKKQFITSTGKIIANVAIYKKLFSLSDEIELEIVKIKGHAPQRGRIKLEEKIFGILDKLSRRKLRFLIQADKERQPKLPLR